MRSGTLIVLAVLLVLLGVLAFLRIDLEPFRPRLEQELSEALGRPTTLEGMSLRFLPLPYVEVRDLRIAGPSEQTPPLAAVGRGEVWFHPWPLILRQTLEITVDLESPEVHVVPGEPLLPVLVPGPIPDRPPGEPSKPAPPDAEERSAAPALVLRGIRVSDGRASWGDLKAEKIEASGWLEGSGAGAVEMEADVPGVGRLRAVEVRIAAGEPVPQVDASGRLLDVDLAGLDRALALGQGLVGGIEGRLSARLAGAEIKQLQVEAELTDAGVSEPAVRASGVLRLEAAAGGPVLADMTDMDLRVPEVLHKRAGVPLRLEGTLQDPIDWTRLEGLLLDVAGVRIPVAARLDGSPTVRIGPGPVPLAPLLALLEGAPTGVGGTVRLEGPVTLKVEPLEVRGAARLESVEVPVGDASASVSGPIQALGSRIRSDGLQVDLAEQRFLVAPTVEIPSGDFTVEAKTDGSDLEALGRTLTGRTELAGILAGRTVLSGALPSEGADLLSLLRGNARLDVREGHIRGFSLAKEALGQLAAFPILVAQLRGKDLSRYEEQDFEEFSGDFQLTNGLLSTENLTLRYRHSGARLRGNVRLEDGALDLSGTLTLSKELDAELGAETSVKERVIPISAVKGTVTRPRVVLDREAVTAAAHAYLGQERVREKLDERLGPGGADVIEGVLDRILSPKRDPK